MSEPRIDRFIRRQGWLEPVADFLQAVVGGTYRVLGRPGRFLKDLLHGTRPLGHPLHPAVTDVPIGAWGAGVVLDYVAHFTDRVPQAAGDVALAVGLSAAALAVVTGLTDYHETFGHERRIATAHGLTIVLVVGFDLASLLLRWFAGAGAHPAAVALSTAGFALLTVGGYLGGHLVFGIGTMVNRNAFVEPPEGETDAGAPGDFPEGEMRRVLVGDLPALVVRRDGTLHAIAAVCSHAGGPLDEGTLDGDVVTCPWHGSRFCVRDGRVLGGPATFPERAFDVQETDGRVTLRFASPAH